MKGVLLAGGTGSRLHPITLVVSKQLIPVYDKPMIYYPLSVLMLAGIQEILIITTPRDLPQFEQLLGDGSRLGCRFSYACQEKPEGQAQALVIAADFVGDDHMALIMGDNLFFGSGFGKLLRQFTDIDGAMIFAAQVHDPGRYGVVELDDSGQVISLEEKPQQPKSQLAVPGLYFYDNRAIEFARQVQRSPRGEYEITDVNRQYLEAGALHATRFDRGIAWLDVGTFGSLVDASRFVQVIEERQNTRIGCIEEVAFYMNFIDDDQLEDLAGQYRSGYGDYLRNLPGRRAGHEV